MELRLCIFSKFCKECTDVSYVAGERVELTGVSKTRGRGQSVGVYLFFLACCLRLGLGLLSTDPNPNPNPKPAFLKKKIDPEPAFY